MKGKGQRERKRVLFKPKLGQLPGICNLHKEDSALGKKRLVQSYIWVLHKGKQIMVMKDIP